jgi:hypothetical protein
MCDREREGVMKQKIVVMAGREEDEVKEADAPKAS